MKRIKGINGYTIYQSTTKRDEDNYGCFIGSYSIYLSSDIRDYGLSYSSPEYEDIDTLTEALNICRASKWAIACALAEEISGSTCQDIDLCLEIETRLDEGESVQSIKASFHYDEDEDLIWEEDKTEDDELDEDLCDGDLEDMFEEAMSAGDRADANLDYDPEETDLLCRAMRAAGYGYLGLDRDGLLYFADDHLQNIFFPDWPAVRDWLEGVVFDDPEVSDAVERILHPERFTEEKPKRQSHASYIVVETCDPDCQWLTVAYPRPAEMDDEQYRKLFFRKLAERIAFEDCSDDVVAEIVFDGEPCHYTGWQPGMVMEFASDLTGEIVYTGCFPEWDH